MLLPFRKIDESLNGAEKVVEDNWDFVEIALKSRHVLSKYKERVLGGVGLKVLIFFLLYLILVGHKVHGMDVS